MQKKKWERPELIVLVRGEPEEDILLACKRVWVSGPSTVAHYCGKMYYGECRGCSRISPS